MLSVTHLQVSYGRVPALWEVSFAVPAGEIVALVGANGAGKTTTLRTIFGLLRPRSGTISFHGERLSWRPSPPIAQPGTLPLPAARRPFSGNVGPGKSPDGCVCHAADGTRGAARKGVLHFPRREGTSPTGSRHSLRW